MFTQKLQKSTIEKIVTWRKVKFVSLKEVRKITFVFDVAEEDNMEAVKFLTSYAADNKVDCQGIAISLGKDTSSESVLGYGIKLITKKNLSRIGVPDPHLVDKFLTESSDLYIDFTKTYNFTREYLALSSVSTFKVGRHINEPNPYDLVVTNDGEVNSSLEFIKKTFHYLNTIKGL